MSSIHDFFDYYAAFVESRAKELNSVTMNLHHATTGISGEAGEALDITKKMWIYNQDLSTVNKEGQIHYTHLKEELGDILFYVQHACNILGVAMPVLIEENMAKLNKRYPVGYSDKAALERADKTGKEI